MAVGSFQNYGVQVIGKCICEIFALPLHDLIFRPHIKRPHHKFSQKGLFPHGKPFQEERSPILLRRRRKRYDALSSYFFPFLKVSYLPFVVQTMVFHTKLPSHCVFKVTHCGYEIFQIILSLKYKIFLLKTIFHYSLKKLQTCSL